MFALGTRLAIIFMLSLLAMLEANPLHKKELEERNATKTTMSTSSPASPWLNRVTSPNPRARGCWNRPWICNKGGGKFPPVIKKSCCKNRCVDVSSDMNHCGLCGIRCPFTWQCCYGLCIDTNANPYNCGECTRECPSGSLCFYGMCGYAQPLPPFPFPFPFPPFPDPFPPFPPFPDPFPPFPPFPPFSKPSKKPLPPLSPKPPKQPLSPFSGPLNRPPKPHPPFSKKN